MSNVDPFQKTVVFDPGRLFFILFFIFFLLTINVHIDG